MFGDRSSEFPHKGPLSLYQYPLQGSSNFYSEKLQFGALSRKQSHIHEMSSSSLALFDSHSASCCPVCQQWAQCESTLHYCVNLVKDWLFIWQIKNKCLHFTHARLMCILFDVPSGSDVQFKLQHQFCGSELCSSLSKATQVISLSHMPISARLAGQPKPLSKLSLHLGGWKEHEVMKKPSGKGKRIY